MVARAAAPAVQPDHERRSGQELLRLLRGAILLSLVLLALFLVANVLFVIFIGVLLAVALRGLADWIAARTLLTPAWALALVVLALILAVSVAAYFIAPNAGTQLNQLFQRLPAEIGRLRSEMGQTSWGQAILHAMPEGQGSAVAGHVFGAATTTIDIVASAVVIAFIGLYLAAAPGIYVAGAIRLAPPARRDRLCEVLRSAAHALRWWLLGRFISMLFVAVMTAIVLWLLGVQLALTLALIAGLFTFVPYIGSVASAIPAVLIALTQSATLAIYVALLYVGVHLVEGYLLAPLMQQRMVHLPPALTLAAQAVLGALFGVIGLTVATPLVAAAVVIVRMLYVEDVLHDRRAAEL